MIGRQVHPVRFHDDFAYAFIVNTAQYGCRFHAGRIHPEVQVKGRVITPVHRTVDLILPGSLRKLYHGRSLMYVQLPVKRGRFGLGRLQKVLVVPMFFLILFYENRRSFQVYGGNSLFQPGKRFKGVHRNTDLRHGCDSLLLLIPDQDIFYQKRIASGPGYGT